MTQTASQPSSKTLPDSRSAGEPGSTADEHKPIGIEACSASETGPCYPTDQNETGRLPSDPDGV